MAFEQNPLSLRTAETYAPPAATFDGPNTPATANELQVSGELDASRPQTVLHLAGGRSVAVPTELLLGNAPAAPAQPRVADVAGAGEQTTREQVIPLVAEQAIVSKETVTTGKVRLHRDTETFTETVGLELTRTGWEVDRVPVGQLYAERPEVRREGDLTVFPLVEERLVARKEFFLIEEVRVRHVASTTERTATLELKRDTLTVEREDPASPSGNTMATR